jgi:hypothetical protein
MLRIVLLFSWLLFTYQAFGQSKDPNIELWKNAKNMSIYIIKDTLQYTSGIAYIWKIIDFKEPNIIWPGTNGAVCKSMRIHFMYNCSDRSEKAISVKCFKDKMGFGVEINSGYIASESNLTLYSLSDWEAKGFDKFCKKFWEIWK